MENERFNPTPQPPDDHSSADKQGLYEELPVKDYTNLLVGKKEPPKKRPHKGRNIALVIVALVIIGGGGFFGYTKFVKKATTTKPAIAAHSTVAVAKKAPTTIATTNYSSSNFNTTLDYPTTWKVASDTVASLIIESPEQSLPAASGSSINGKIIFTIVPQGQIPVSYGTNDANAVLPSQLISYTNPTSSQRAQTYLSFLQYAATTATTGLDGIYVTGDFGYQQSQDIPRTDIANLNPLVYITFGQCVDSSCTNLQSTTISSSVWKDSSFNLPILTLLKSLAFS